MKAPTADKVPPFVDTPRGIFTASGNWFNTSEAALREYAAGVLAHKDIPELLRAAELWLSAPRTLVLWLTPLLLWKFGVWATIGCGLVLFFVLSVWGPAFLVSSLTPLLKILDNVAAQAALYVGVMSWFAINGQFDLMATGLTIFILMRWGIIGRLLKPIIEKLWARIYAIPYADQMLKAVIIRTAMKHHVPIPELEEMERSILRRINRT